MSKSTMNSSLGGGQEEENKTGEENGHAVTVNDVEPESLEHSF